MPSQKTTKTTTATPIASETRPLAALTPWDKNPRGINKPDFARLKTQITKHKQYKPLLINQDGVILGGNMRYHAMKELGYTDVWVSVVDAQTEKDMIEYALSDNDRAGFYEEAKLAELVMDIDIDFDTYMVDLGHLTDLKTLLDKFRPTDEDDFDPEDHLPETPVSQLGDVYQLGTHRLMCGDATNQDDVNKLMDGHKADMVFTDPPYGVDYEGKTKDKLKITNDKTTETWAKALPNYALSVKQGASFYVCCPPGNNFKDFLIPFGEVCYQSSTIIWAKNSLVLGHGDYHYQHEPILYGWLKGGTHLYYGNRSQTTLWSIDRPTVAKEHPTMKPLSLVTRAVNNSSKSGDIVIDLFGGSGSTLMACEQTNRICYMLELDPRYVDVIVTRWEKYTGEKAVKL